MCDALSVEKIIMRWKWFRHRLEFLGVSLLIALARLFPLKAAVWIGGALGAFAFEVARIRRSVTLDNIERAFGSSLGSKEKVRIGKRSYVNFAKSIVEFAFLEKLKRGDYERLVRFHGLENLCEPLERGHGAIAVTGHFGSWELLGAAVAAKGVPVDFLVGEQTNDLVNDIMNRLRRSAGIGTIERGISARGVFESLKRCRVVALLADQDARKAGIFVDFFGIPASTFQGPAQFSLRTGAPLVCCCIVRREDDTHDAFLLPPIYPRSNGDREEEVRRLTQEHTKALERCIRTHPDHYFWAHRRWKTVPPKAQRSL